MSHCTMLENVLPCIQCCCSESPLGLLNVPSIAGSCTVCEEALTQSFHLAHCKYRCVPVCVCVLVFICANIESHNIIKAISAIILCELYVFLHCSQ